MVTAILTIIVLHKDPLLRVEKLFLKDILINKLQIFQKEWNQVFHICVYVCMLCLVVQLYPTPWDTLHCSPPGYTVHGIFQARILEWVAISFSRGSSQTRDQNSVFCVSCIAGGFFTCWAIPYIMCICVCVCIYIHIFGISIKMFLEKVLQWLPSFWTLGLLDECSCNKM